MSDKCPKGQRQRLGFKGKCKINCDCDLPAVPKVAEIKRENLISKITNPDIEIEDKGLERLRSDMLDGAYTNNRKEKGTY